jgi:hypothetical protein
MERIVADTHTESREEPEMAKSDAGNGWQKLEIRNSKRSVRASAALKVPYFEAANGRRVGQSKIGAKDFEP